MRLRMALFSSRSADMTFQVSGLPVAQFAPLFGLSDAELAKQDIVRHTADKSPGFPCRVSLRDAEAGGTRRVAAGCGGSPQAAKGCSGSPRAAAGCGGLRRPRVPPRCLDVHGTLVALTGFCKPPHRSNEFLPGTDRIDAVRRGRIPS